MCSQYAVKHVHSSCKLDEYTLADASVPNTVAGHGQVMDDHLDLTCSESNYLPGYCRITLWLAGVIAIEPDVHAVAVMGSANGPANGRPALANRHAPSSKKPSAPVKVLALLHAAVPAAV